MTDIINNTNQVENTTDKIDISYILEQIKKIQEQNEYLHEALSNLSKMSDGDSGDSGSPGNIQGQAKAQAYADIVKCRETTNQQILSIYEKIYDDIMPHKKTKVEMVIECVTNLVKLNPEYDIAEISSMIDTIRFIHD